MLNHEIININSTGLHQKEVIPVGKKLERRRTTPVPKRGARTLYNPHIHPHLARWMTRCGLTDEMVAQEFGVTRMTIHNWRKRHPEFAEAMIEGKEVADAKVEDSLYRRALGYDYQETHEEYSEGEDGKVYGRKVKVVDKHVLPDVQAAIYWLTNRQGDRWKARQQLEVTGKDGEKLFEVKIIQPQAADKDDD